MLKALMIPFLSLCFVLPAQGDPSLERPICTSTKEGCYQHELAPERGRTLTKSEWFDLQMAVEKPLRASYSDITKIRFTVKKAKIGDESWRDADLLLVSDEDKKMRLLCPDWETKTSPYFAFYPHKNTPVLFVPTSLSLPNGLRPLFLKSLHERVGACQSFIQSIIKEWETCNAENQATVLQVDVDSQVSIVSGCSQVDSLNPFAHFFALPRSLDLK